MRTYLEPTAPIAADAIVVDDPKLAMDLAAAACEAPRMSNLSHGLWGYHGTTAEGAELTVQSLGIGGPSAAVVMDELAGLGVARAIRIGSCIALEPGGEPGSAFIVDVFEPRDGAGATLAEGQSLRPDESLTEALEAATGIERRGAVRSVDIVTETAGREVGAPLLDLASAAFAAAGAKAGVACAEAVIVARPLTGPGLDMDALNEALIGLGKRAATAFEAVVQAS